MPGMRQAQDDKTGRVSGRLGKTSGARGKAQDDKIGRTMGRLRMTGHILYRFVILTQPA